MNGKRRLFATLAAWIVASVPAFCQTADDALKAVPEKAAGFVIINNLEEMSSKIEATAKRLGMPLPVAPLEMLKGHVGIDKGLNSKGSLLVAMILSKDEDLKPIPLIYVPVTDYKRFIAGLGAKTEGGVTTVQLHNGTKPMIVGKNGSFAVLTEPDNGEFLKEAMQPREGANDALAPIRPYLAKNNVTGVLTPRGLKIFTEKARAGLALAKDNAPLPPEAAFMADVFVGLDGFLKSVGTDVSHLIVCSRQDKAGNLDFNGAALFVPGSSFAKSGAKAPALTGGHLPGLPSIPFIFAMSGPVTEDGLLQQMIDFSTKITVAVVKDAPEAKVKKLERIGQDAFKGLRGLSMIMGVGKDKESLFSNVSGLLKVNDTEKYFKNTVDYLETYNDMMKGIALPEGFPKQSMNAKRATVAGLPALEVTVDMGVDQQQNELVRKMMEAYFGEGGKMIATSVALDKTTIFLRYKPAESIKKLPNLTTAGLAQNKETIKTLQMLPESSQWVALMSPQGFVAFTQRIMAGFMPQGAAMKLPNFPATPPIGVGLKLSATGLEKHLVIPAEVLESIGTYIQQLQKGTPGSQVSR